MVDDRVVASSTENSRLLSPTPQATPNNNNLVMNLPPPPGREFDPLATYVVQIPKDQIYRTPPPENAGTVERHREAAKAKKTKKKRNSCCTYFIWIAVVLLGIGVILGGTLLAIYFIYVPKGPHFTVSKVHVKQQKQGGAPTYDVTLKAKNRNENMGIEYKRDGESAALSFSNIILGFGDFPRLNQKVGDSSNVHIKIHGLKNKRLPANVKKSIGDKKTKHQVSLKLKFESTLVFNVWKFNLWKKHMDVTCKFKVSTMAAGSKIMSQNCKTKMS